MSIASVISSVGEIISDSRLVPISDTTQQSGKVLGIRVNYSDKAQLHDWGAWPATTSGAKEELRKMGFKEVPDCSFAFRD
jgi:hypothetical protein